MNNSFWMKIRQGVKFLPYLVCLAFLFAMPVIAFAATTVGDAVSVGTTLAVTGAASLNGAVTLGNETGDDITVTGYVASSIYPKTDGAYDLGASSTLKRWGYLNASKGLMISNGTNTTTYYLTSSMLGQASGYNLGKFYIDSSGNVSATGTLAAFGATTLNGAVTLGNETGDDITVTGYIASNVIPKTNDAYDLGAFSKAYNNIFVSSTAYLATVSTTQIAPWENNTSDFGNYAFAWKNVFVSGTTYTSGLTADGDVVLGRETTDVLSITARLASDILSLTNGAVNLGAFGNAFGNIYASSTAYSASSTVFNPSTTSSVYIKSGTDNFGGQLILKAYNGTCYSVYIGKFNDGALGVTSTALGACY